MNENISPLFSKLQDKASLKQDIYTKTLNTFKTFYDILFALSKEYEQFSSEHNATIPFKLTRKNEFEIELQFGGDILIFMMHTNIFEFSRDHEVMKTPYIKEDKLRSYCGVIHIFNFLADSFKYNRLNDIGYLIGRLFVNKELHYFIEGKREVGLLYPNFATSVVNEQSIRKIIESAIEYTLNFDLLTPAFDSIKEVSVDEIQTTADNIKLKTGKRLGFKFQADHDL
jgi:hypothetical protein